MARRRADGLSGGRSEAVDLSLPSGEGRALSRDDADLLYWRVAAWATAPHGQLPLAEKADRDVQLRLLSVVSSRYYGFESRGSSVRIGYGGSRSVSERGARCRMAHRGAARRVARRSTQDRAKVGVGGANRQINHSEMARASASGGSNEAVENRCAGAEPRAPRPNCRST